jgi:hypothetical protein
MSNFTQLDRILEIDDTADKAVESYGSFVKYMNNLEDKIKEQNSFLGKGWTQARIDFAEGARTIPFFHKAICDKFGSDAMIKAINAHPFQ